MTDYESTTTKLLETQRISAFGGSIAKAKISFSSSAKATATEELYLLRCQCIHICKSTHKQIRNVYVYIYDIYIYMYVCMYLCMYLCIYVSMYVCMYVCIYVSMYVGMYICIYVFLFVCIKRTHSVFFMMRLCLFSLASNQE